jgi:hypothetical protein
MSPENLAEEANMSVFAIPLTTIGVALAFSLPLGSQAGTRTILREKVDAQGRVGDDLATRTGWRVARGFRWQILLADATGRFQPVRPDQIFRTGQAFRLCIEAQCDLWIYILDRDPAGREMVLLPTRGEEHLLVEQGQQANVPPDGQFRFTDPPGIEDFRILASPAKLDWVNPRELFAMEADKALDDREREKAEAQKAARTKAIAALQRSQSGRRLVSKPWHEVVDELAADPGLRRRTKDTMVVEPPQENAQLVVQASADPADRGVIVFDIKLQHRHP